MEMEVRHLPFAKSFDLESQRWCVVGKDMHGADFGIGVARKLESAVERLREWVEEVLAQEGRAWEDLPQGKGAGDAISFVGKQRQ